MKMESDLNDSGDAASSELEARSEEFVERLNGPLYRIKIVLMKIRLV